MRQGKEKEVKTIIACVFLLLMGLSTILVLSANGKTVKQDIDMEKSEKSPEFREFAVNLALTTNQFRLKAAGKTSEAISQFGTPECVDLWNKDFKSMFDSKEMELGDFFSNAILLIGRINNFHAVAAFYNPWSDGLCLTAWRQENDKFRMIRLIFVSGESWRSEVLDPNSPPLPKWQQSGKTVARALLVPYTETVKLFDRDYPIDGEFQFLPHRLRKIVQKDKQEKEVHVLRRRMGFRMLMFKEFIQSTAGTETYILKQKAVEIKNLIASGNREAVEAMIKGMQSPMMVDGLFNASASVRKRFSYNCMMLKGARGIVTMVNPELPQWFVILYIDLDVDNQQGLLDSVEMHKFELLKHLESAPEAKDDK